MRVSRVEIFGFKSFLERLVIPLDTGITGVVGPNGCGKSNIIDALRWVLGETKAKNLRGGVLEDVIFNGTDKLRPLGLAEVTITLRANGENFFDEIISPELEALHIAEGESVAGEELSPDGDEAQEPGIEPPAQGQVRDRPHLTVIPGNLERKGAVDEGTPSAEQIAEGQADNIGVLPNGSKPSGSLSLLAKFSWLKAASEVQVTRRLYRSGESEFFINRVACRLKDIKELFRAVGISARSYTIVAQGEISRIITARPEERRMILEEAAGVLGFRDKIATASRRLEETEVNLSRINDVMKEVSRQVNSLSRQASRARNRERLKGEIAEREKALFRAQFLDFEEKRGAAQEEERELKEQESQVDAKLHRLQSSEHEARSELISLDVEGDSLRSKIDALREELSNRMRLRADKHVRINERKAFIDSARGEIRRMGEREEILAGRLRELNSDISILAGKDHALSERVRNVEGESVETLKSLMAQLDALRERLKRHEEDRRKAREELISKESGLAAMEEQLNAASPVNQLRKTLGAEQWKTVTDSIPEIGLFIDGLTVPSRYATAVQAVLREQAEFLIADEPHAVARKFMSQILSRRLQDAAQRFGLGVFKAGVSTRVNNPDVPLKRLRDEIVADARSEAAANKLFQNVYLADTVEEALDYFERGRGPRAVTLVTLDGDLICEDSFVSLRSEGGLLQLRDRTEEYRSRCRELRQHLLGVDTECEKLQSALAECERRYAEALRQSEERHSQVRELSAEQGSVRGKLESSRRIVSQVEQDTAGVSAQKSELMARVSTVEGELGALQTEVAALIEEADAEIKDEVSALQSSYNSIDEKRKSGRERLSQLSSEAEEVRAELDQVRAKLSQCLLEFQKEEMLLQNLRDKVMAEYGDEMAAFVFSADTGAERLSAELRNEHAREVLALRGRIAREGDVDPASIEQYEQEKARLQDLTSQHDDLESAAATLKETIERLTQTSEQRFLATLEAVRNNFAKLVPRFFGGGRGTLELLDPAHPLESGIEIIARPPGKKLKSIELLSGGEKALCATALIFSMFLERPSPLCVLDEVDAPLDDANVVRFLTLIKEMSARTQFLLVTHNKQSMSVADKLIGVTMQEPGASKVISVSLQEAYSQVA